MQLNSLLAVQDFDTSAWKYSDKKELFVWQGASSADYVNFDCFEEWCFFKSNLKSDLQTLTSCNYNSYLVNDSTLGGRECK